jgi:hypothetical protein
MQETTTERDFLSSFIIIITTITSRDRDRLSPNEALELEPLMSSGDEQPDSPIDMQPPHPK